MLDHVDPEAGHGGVGDWADQQDKGEHHAQIKEKLPHLADSVAGWALSYVPENFSAKSDGKEDIPAEIEVHLRQFTHENVICESFLHDPQ